MSMSKQRTFRQETVWHYASRPPSDGKFHLLMADDGSIVTWKNAAEVMDAYPRSFVAWAHVRKPKLPKEARP